VDPDGKEGEENDWVPVIRLNKLSKQTEVKYEPEKGDSVETLQQQYGLTKEQANELYYNHRD
jgi:LysM repeat protein